LAPFLQAVASGLSGNLSNDLISLFVQLFRLLFQLGDVLAQILFVIFSEGFGIPIPVTIFRILTLVVSFALLWFFFEKIGVIVKLIAVIFILGMIISVFSGSPWNPCSVLTGGIC